MSVCLTLGYGRWSVKIKNDIFLPLREKVQILGKLFLIDLHKLIGTYDNNQGRSVVFPSRYAQGAEEKRVPKARAARGVWGHAPPEQFLATFGTTGISNYVEQAKGEICNVHSYNTRFKSCLNGRMFVVRFTFFQAATP